MTDPANPKTDPMSIDRFDHVRCRDECEADMAEAVDGEFVLHEDHAATVTELRAQLQTANAGLADAWDWAYRAGVDDERGNVAHQDGFCAVNPHRREAK